MKDIQLIKNENIELRLKLDEKGKLTAECIELIELKETLDTYLLAHKESRDYHNRIDKLCNIMTLGLTCATSYLVTAEEQPTNDIPMYIAFGSAFFSGLTNLLNPATKSGEHRGIILMYTDLINKITECVNCGTPDEPLYKKYYIEYIQLNSQSTKLGLRSSIREKYNII
jgi:hypothetical protein